MDYSSDTAVAVLSYSRRGLAAALTAARATVFGRLCLGGTQGTLAIEIRDLKPTLGEAALAATSLQSFR